MASCVGDNSNRITLTTDEPYTTTAGDLSITVHSLTNWAAELQSGIITIDVKYSDEIIDESPESEDNRRITTTEAITALQFVATDTDIETAAEMAKYTFEL